MDNENQNTTGVLVRTDEEISNLSIKTVFHLLTGKPDSKSKVFNRNVCIDMNSLDDLYDRIARKLKVHYNQSTVVNVSIHIVFDDKRSLNFSGWDDYKKKQITNPSSIRNITLIWNALLKLPEFEIPQRHKLTVKLSDGMRPQELLNLVFSGKIEEVEDISVDSPVVVSVDFIDQQIGDELINIVSEWVETVLENEKRHSKFMQLMVKHKRKIAYFLNWITTIFSIVCVFLVLRASMLKNGTVLLGKLKVNILVGWLTIIILGIIICFLIYRISYYLANNIFRVLEYHGETHNFKITNGDKNEIKRIDYENENNWKKVLRNIGVTVLINVLCGIISTVITRFL